MKTWLKETFPQYDWKTKHHGIYEYDIHSKLLDDFYIEYNGACHYKQIHSVNNFNNIQRRDKLKCQIMKKLHKKFIVVKDSMSFSQQKIFVLESFNLQKENSD